jgi:glutaredoxin
MSPDIVLFMRPGCNLCRLAKEYLDNHHVAYRERDVSRDAAAEDELRRIHAGGVPVILIDRDAVIGFDKIRLDDLLKSRGVPIGPPA